MYEFSWYLHRRDLSSLCQRYSKSSQLYRAIGSAKSLAKECQIPRAFTSTLQYFYTHHRPNKKGHPLGWPFVFSNALLFNHLSGADTRSRTRDLLITRTLLTSSQQHVYFKINHLHLPENSLQLIKACFCGHFSLYLTMKQLATLE